MQIIKNEFIIKITQSAKNAVGSSIVLQIGINGHQQIASTHPNATLRMEAGSPVVRKINLAPTHQQIQNILTNNRNILFELYLTELVQYWLDFLDNIYRKALQDNLSGATKYSIPLTKCNVNFTLTGQMNLSQSLIDSACNDFNFLAASHKLKTVKKLLGINLLLVANHETVIKTNIQVRNILQHRKGIVCSSDLKKLNVRFITEDHGDTISNIAAKDKITRTGFDIENFVHSLIIIAKTLIP